MSEHRLQDAAAPSHQPADALEGAQPPVDALSFEQALDELDALVRQMEAGDLPLDASIAAYRRGAALAQHCQGKLAVAEQQLSKLDGDALKPLDPAELRGGV